MATGLRKIIYIPNEEIWQGIQASAKRANRSVSNFLVTLYQDSVRVGDHEQGDKQSGQNSLKSYSKDTQLGRK